MFWIRTLAVVLVAAVAVSAEDKKPGFFGRLREKIEADSAHPRLLNTVWGVGYRFDPVPLGRPEAAPEERRD